MPIHDWKSAPAGLFHHFHQSWTVELCDVLNEGVLPEGYVPVPLEATYQRTWDRVPKQVKEMSGLV